MNYSEKFKIFLPHYVFFDVNNFYNQTLFMQCAHNYITNSKGQ